jgi:hypothetical protein
VVGVSALALMVPCDLETAKQDNAAVSDAYHPGGSTAPARHCITCHAMFIYKPCAAHKRLCVFGPI